MQKSFIIFTQNLHYTTLPFCNKLYCLTLPFTSNLVQYFQERLGVGSHRGFTRSSLYYIRMEVNWQRQIIAYYGTAMTQSIFGKHLKPTLIFASKAVPGGGATVH